MNTLDHLRITRTERLTNPYMAAGSRAYLIGKQDGSFPDFGWHVKGEMGGLWAHPIKLLDGFWLSVDGAWLTGADRYTSGPFWSAHEYDLPGGLTVTRRQFVPDNEPALVVRYTFTAPEARTLRLRFLARTDLQGVWLSDMEGIRDGHDHARWDEALQAWVCRDDLNPWFVAVGARGGEPVGRESGRLLWGPEETAGRGVSVAVDVELTVPGTIEFVVAGSDVSELVMAESFRRVVTAGDELWAAKSLRYEQMLGRSALAIPEPEIAAAWDWVKCNYDWMMREVPALGSGLGAGAQDYPWWFGCDNTYAIFGCLALGQHEFAVQTLDLVRRLSEAWNGDSGRVIHEANTRGYVFNPGNTQETPHFVKAVWHTFLWTGDLEFLRRNYGFCKRGLLEWTLGEKCPDGDLLPYGYGIIEIEDLNLQCVDTAAYTVEALAALGAMAEVLGEGGVAARCRTLYEGARARLDEAFWLEEEGLYGDMLATPAEMAPRLQGWAKRADAPDHKGRVKPAVAAAFREILAGAEAEPDQDRKRSWPFRNWIVACPLEAGLADLVRAARTLERLETPEFSGPHGIYLSGIDHTNTMSISTGVVVVAELAYGRVDQALGYIRQIVSSLGLHMPGAISEMSPDHGCFVQAWSGYGVAWPIVAQVFGLRPDAFRRRLGLAPCFPAGWPAATLRGVRIGTGSFDFDWDGQVLTVMAHEPGWEISAAGVPLRVVHAGGGS